MSTDIIVPKVGFNSEEGQVNEWLAADGDQVTEGQPLLTLESEKSAVEIEAPAAGKLTILVAAGETRPVGAVIGRID